MMAGYQQQRANGALGSAGTTSALRRGKSSLRSMGRSKGMEASGSIYASTILSMEIEEDEADEERNRLNDQQWVLQRKKIGLSRRTKRSLSRVRGTKTHQQTVLDFIRNFNRKECTLFVADPNKKFRPNAASPGPKYAGPCYCGKPEDEHDTRATIIRGSMAKESKARFDTIEEGDEADSLSESTTGSTAPIIKVESRLGDHRDHNPLERPARSSSVASGINEIMRNSNFSSVDTTNSLRMDVDREKGRPSGVQSVSHKELAPPPPAQQIRDPRGAASPQEDILPSTFEEWSKRAIHEFPTDAYGQIEFMNEDEGSLKPSKYIRLSDKTPMHLVRELLVDHWNIFKPFRPHLALSMIGGAKNFRMEGRKKETFKKGLISAAKSTNALILTGGNNTGSMKLVGDAIRDGQYMVRNGDKMSRGLKLLGLCSYGYVKDFHHFVNSNLNEFNYVRYNSNAEIKRSMNVPLNGDHTHFILIDDGSRYRFFNAHTEFITRFETMVRDPQTNGGLGIPIVTLLLEGGKDAIRIVKDRLKEGIACVVIEGSGRAADIISYAHKNAIEDKEKKTFTLKEGHIAHLMKMLKESYRTLYKTQKQLEDGIKEVMNWLTECIRYSNIITIFDIRRETELDKKILTALLKSDNMSLNHQLFLAMVWDRVDLVEEKILTKDTLNSMDDLSETMMQALLMERVAFIELLVMNGFVMRSFLTVEKLRELYNEAALRFKELPHQLRSFIGFKGRVIHLRTIHKYFVSLLKDHRHTLYERDTPFKGDKDEKQLLDVSQRRFDEPYVELFLWAVLTDRHRLIDFFWHRCKQPILMAIVAAAIYSKLGWFYRGISKHVKVLQERKVLFQDRANKLIELAYEVDQDKAYSLLEKRNLRWGGRNLMQLSYIGHLRNFIANAVCQNVVHSSWKRGFTFLPWYSCLLGNFLPFIVFTPMVKFVRGLGDDGGELTCMQKMYVLHKSPVVKYTGTCFSFLVLILLYSYVALFGFRVGYQFLEVVLYCWILILILDEFREILIEPSKTLRGKFGDYYNSVWNRFDLMMYGLTIFVVVLKNFKSTFMAARIMFSCNSAFFYIRVFRIYHASRKLGPKLVIFHRMIPEIITFMFLLLIFILAYGVASQAMIEPTREFSFAGLGPLLFDIIFLPYWQMYGELSLDKIEVKPAVPCSSLLAGNASDENQSCYLPEVEDLEAYGYVTPMLLAIYLLIGNVMLLNLLIAIFTSVFEEVHVNSNDVWKWEMYRLVEEYDKRPGLAPPFVILEDIFKLMKVVWKKTCRTRKENLDSYMQETLETLKLFERDIMSMFTANEEQKKQSSLEVKVVNLHKKTDQLLELFEEAPDDLANWGETIDMADKLYGSSSSDDQSDGDTNVSGRSKSSLTVRFEETTTKKKKRREMLAHIEEADPKVNRIATARESVMNRKLHADLREIKDQLDLIEERRKRDMEKILEKISK